MLDVDLAELYGTETKRLKEAVRRNIERFDGDDFMFQLTNKEFDILMSLVNIISKNFKSFKYGYSSTKN